MIGSHDSDERADLKKLLYIRLKRDLHVKSSPRRRGMAEQIAFSVRIDHQNAPRSIMSTILVSDHELPTFSSPLICHNSENDSHADINSFQLHYEFMLICFYTL